MSRDRALPAVSAFREERSVLSSAFQPRLQPRGSSRHSGKYLIAAGLLTSRC